jgi:predicted  nucleic acid-binding Zn-ribbon protein
LKEEERTEKWTEEGVERSEGRIEGREGFPKGWAEAERTRKSEKGVVPSISREEKSAKVGRISTILSGAEAEAQSAKPTSSDQKTEGEAKDSSQPPIESIRISEPGSYEINLPSLFERDSLVMSMREGTYLIDLATAFKKPKKE